MGFFNFGARKAAELTFSLVKSIYMYKLPIYLSSVN